MTGGAVHKRVLWYLAGILAAEAVTQAVRRFGGWPHLPDFSFGAGAFAIVYGEKTGHLEKVEPSNRPITIFDGKVPRT